MGRPLSALARWVRSKGGNVTRMRMNREEILDALRQLTTNHRIRMDDAEKDEPAGGARSVELDSLRSFHEAVQMLVRQEADPR